ncbi:MAG: hypothetical protein IKI15_10285 [Lachnospiraceae bacterium]|nr:hypothetical protein [Lachnospiraceae bacterium]
MEKGTVMTRFCFADMGYGVAFLAGLVYWFYTCLTISIITGVIALGYGIFCWARYRKYNKEHPDDPDVKVNARRENTTIILLIVLGFVCSIGFLGFVFHILAIIRGHRLARESERECVYKSEYDSLAQELQKMSEEESERSHRRRNDLNLEFDTPEDPKRR